MMGEILFLAHRLPWPPDRGDRIRSWHILTRLTELAPVHVVTLIDDVIDLNHVPAVERVAASVTVARRSSMLSATARGLVTGMPASVAAFVNRKLERAVARLLAERPISTIFAFSSQMAHYVPRDFAGRFVMDFVDMDSAKFTEIGMKARGLSGFANRQEGNRLFDWECRVAARAHASLFVSDAEAVLFSSRSKLNSQVIENGVDTTLFDPSAVQPAQATRPSIAFTGQMDYRPNAEAVVEFATHVLPLIEGAHFTIVGRAPTAEVRALSSDRVTVTGEVPDTRPWLAAADVVVAPLLLARGIQNKVLEAMSMARTVIASAGAADGIDAADGKHLIVADGPVAQSVAICDLLADPARAAVIGTAARARMIERYSWEACLAPLADLVAV